MAEEKEPSSLERKLLPTTDAKKAVGITDNAVRRLLTAVHSEREESFAQAVERLGWTEQDIAGFVNYRKKEVAIYGSVTLVAFLFACASPYSTNWLLHCLASLAVMGIMASRLLVSHFRLTQARDRALYSFWEYLRLTFARLKEGLQSDKPESQVDKSDPTEQSEKVVDLTRPRE